MACYTPAVRLAQSVEHETLNLRVEGSSPTLGVSFIVKNNWSFLSYDLDFAGKILIDLQLGPQITSLRAVGYCIKNIFTFKKSIVNNIDFAVGFFALGPVSAVGSALVS